jgi:predicted small secreted protein
VPQNVPQIVAHVSIGSVEVAVFGAFSEAFEKRVWNPLSPTNFIHCRSSRAAQRRGSPRLTASEQGDSFVMLRKFAILALVAAGAMSLSACNTVRGLGQDIQSVADAGDRVT